MHPPELDRHALAADVLTILHEQRNNRTKAKRAIMPVSSKTCDSINTSEEDSDYKQECRGKSCSDQTAKRTAAPQGSSGEARGDTLPHRRQEHADGAWLSAEG